MIFFDFSFFVFPIFMIITIFPCKTSFVIERIPFPVGNFSVDRCHVHPPISASVKFFAEYKFVTHGSSAGRWHVGQLLGDASASEVEAFLMETSNHLPI